MRRILILVSLVFSTPAWAYFQMDMLKGKNTAAKEAAQWTLSDWLTQKSRISALDQWLALNRQVQWFELIPSAKYRTYRVTTDDGTGAASTSVNRTAQEYNLDLYISILSLSGEYQKTSDDEESYGGAAGLRLFGTSAQSTSLVARYGWRKRQELKTQETWENTYLEGALQLYLIKHFGLNGKYRYYFPRESNLGTRLQGNSVVAGLFLDVGLLRLFANYTQEPSELSKNGTTTKENRQGYDAGIKFLF